MNNQRNVFSEVNPKPKPKQTVVGIVLSLVFVLIMALTVKSCFFGTEEKPEAYKPTKQDAVVESHLVVQKLLKSPGSADFPFQPDETIDQLNDSTFIVLSYVDSQNSFGALLRSHYKCKIIFSKNGQSRCEDLILE